MSVQWISTIYKGALERASKGPGERYMMNNFLLQILKTCEVTNMYVLHRKESLLSIYK